MNGILTLKRETIRGFIIQLRGLIRVDEDSETYRYWGIGYEVVQDSPMINFHCYKKGTKDPSGPIYTYLFQESPVEVRDLIVSFRGAKLPGVADKKKKKKK